MKHNVLDVTKSVIVTKNEEKWHLRILMSLKSFVGVNCSSHIFTSPFVTS